MTALLERERELAELGAAAREAGGRGRAVAIEASAGLGKTAPATGGREAGAEAGHARPFSASDRARARFPVRAGAPAVRASPDESARRSASALLEGPPARPAAPSGSKGRHGTTIPSRCSTASTGSPLLWPSAAAAAGDRRRPSGPTRPRSTTSAFSCRGSRSCRCCCPHRRPDEPDPRERARADFDRHAPRAPHALRP